MPAQVKKPHVVIIGGGFGGLRAARELKRAPVDVTLIDRANHHLFQPLLYQVATAGMAAEEIAVPIRSVLQRQRNAKVLMGDVERVDLQAKQVYLTDGHSLDYDFLVVAAGTQTNYFGHTPWQAHSIGLKTIEDAFALRRRVLLAFEAAEREPDATQRRRLLTFVVIGGGPTGVEMAGALSELSRQVLAKDFRVIDPSSIRVVLIEMAPRVLTPFHPSLSANALRALQALKVEVRVGVAVENIQAEGVRIAGEFIPASVICWAAGVEPQPLAKRIGAAINSRGQVVVMQDCSLAGHPEVFAVGDIAAFTPAGANAPLPGLAPVAMQQGQSVANNIIRTLKNKPRVPFKYFDKGMMATIGRSRAVAQVGRLRFTGLIAWLAWIVVHVAFLIGFRNRVVVLFDWFWAYATQRRGARVIANVEPVVPPKADDPRPSKTDGGADVAHRVDAPAGTASHPAYH